MSARPIGVPRLVSQSLPVRLPMARPARLIVIAGAVALALAACGRRGALEAPPDPNAPKETQTQSQQGSIAPSPVGTPRRSNTGITVPKDPFILDPLL